MPLEEFHQGSQNFNGLDRPEDELETREATEINKRERAFSAEGKFRDLLKLKIAIGDMQFTKPLDWGYTRKVVEGPRTYAVSSLGVSHSEVAGISEKALEKKNPCFFGITKTRITSFY